MMEMKVLFMPVVLLSTLSAYAVENAVLDIPYKQDVGIKLFLGFNTSNIAKMPNNLVDVKFNPELGAQYQINDNYYAGSQLGMDQNKNATGFVLVGAKHAEGALHPYVEVSYHATYGDNKYSDYVDYAVGMQYSFTEQLKPYLRFNQFVDDTKRNVTMGLNIQFIPEIGLDISYNRNLLLKSNTMQGDLIYQF